MQSAVVAEGLTKSYGTFKAVDNIDFSVEEGEVFGFLGPNGAGKTTTMKMIQCVSPKTSGKLIVAGMEVDGHEREIKKILGVAPQEINLDPDFTTFDNLKVYARYFDIPQDDAKERIEKLYWILIGSLREQKLKSAVKSLLIGISNGILEMGARYNAVAILLPIVIRKLELIE